MINKEETEKYEDLLKFEVEKNIQNEVFANIIQNMEKLKLHFTREENNNFLNIRNLNSQFELWLNDVRCCLGEAFHKKIRNIEIKNFKADMKNHNSHIFNDFQQVNYQKLLKKTFEESLKMNCYRTYKRRKSSFFEEENFILTKSKIEAGEEINNFRLQDIPEHYEEVFISKKDNLFEKDSKSTKKQSNAMVQKKYYEDTIEEMPSKEEENLKLSMSNDNNGSELKNLNNFGEDKINLGGLCSEIKKKSMSHEKENKIIEVNSFFGTDEDNIEKDLFLHKGKLDTKNTLLIEGDDKHNFVKMSHQEIFFENNNCNQLGLEISKNNNQNSYIIIEKEIKNESEPLQTLEFNNVKIDNTNNINYPSQNIINNFKNILNKSSMSPVNKSKISNDNNGNSNMSFKNVTKNSIFTFNKEGHANSKGNFKSNLMKDKENLMKLLYDDEDLNSGESPIVEKWSPKESLDCPPEFEEILNRENLNFQTHLLKFNNNMQENKNKLVSSKTFHTNIQSTKSKSHNNLYDNRQTTDRNKDLTNLLSKNKNIFEKEQNEFKENNFTVDNIKTLENLNIQTFQKEKFEDKLSNTLEHLYGNQGYEITDKSGSSDDDYESDSESKFCTPLFGNKQKYIPAWANDKIFLFNRVREQQKIDFKKIFGKVKIENLDLNLIFSGDKKYDDPRGDSADWGQDNSASSRCKDSELKGAKKELIFKN
jgi:hypothetical protein